MISLSLPVDGDARKICLAFLSKAEVILVLFVSIELKRNAVGQSGSRVLEDQQTRVLETDR